MTDFIVPEAGGEVPEADESCSGCGFVAIDPGAQLYTCDRCGALVCSACSENVGTFGVVCSEPCERTQGVSA